MATSAPRSAPALLAALDAFRFDDVERPAWSFAQRLAHEQGWTARTAERALREYKRFLALVCLAGHPVCPSEQVDQVWHQHLTYTRSYWTRLCGEVLGREVHHAPTRGGPAEDAKHREMYRQTLASYRRIFGEEPPAELWPPEAQRFGADLHTVRVNAVTHWILDKRTGRAAAWISLALILAALLGALSA
ncbi:MAG: hypothetical protein R3B48_20870 [Kofleriaceae bacterium]